MLLITVEGLKKMGFFETILTVEKNVNLKKSHRKKQKQN